MKLYFWKHGYSEFITLEYFNNMKIDFSLNLSPCTDMFFLIRKLKVILQFQTQNLLSLSSFNWMFLILCAVQCANHSGLKKIFFFFLDYLDFRGQEQYLVYFAFHLFFVQQRFIEHLYCQAQCSDDIKMNILLSHSGAGFLSNSTFDILDWFFFLWGCLVHCRMSSSISGQ